MSAEPQQGKPTEEPVPRLGLEEDDDFDDFPVEDWGEEEMGEGMKAEQMWETNWDDDDEEPDFYNHLKQVLRDESLLPALNEKV